MMKLGKQLHIIMAAVGFRVNMFALNKANRHLSIAGSLSTAPLPTDCMEISLLAKPYRLTLQAENKD